MEPDGSGIKKMLSDYGSVRNYDCAVAFSGIGRLLLNLVGASKGFENVDTGWSSGDDREKMKWVSKVTPVREESSPEIA